MGDLCLFFPLSLLFLFFIIRLNAVITKYYFFPSISFTGYIEKQIYLPEFSCRSLIRLCRFLGTYGCSLPDKRTALIGLLSLLTGLYGDRLRLCDNFRSCDKKNNQKPEVEQKRFHWQTSSGLQNDRATEPGDCGMHSVDRYICMYSEWFLDILRGDDTLLLYGGNGDSRLSSFVLMTNSCIAFT